MFESTIFEQPYRFIALLGIIFLTILLFTTTCIYLFTNRKRKKQSNAALAQKRLLYSSPASITPKIPTKATDRFVFPLPKLENTETSSKIICETLPQCSIGEIPSNYKTFDFAKRYQRHLSSDSSYTSSTNRRSYPPPSFSFDTVKSKIQQVHCRSTPSPILCRPLEAITSEQTSRELLSDSDEQDNESLTTPATPSFEYSLLELFRIDIIYKLHYSIDDSQLLFQLIRLASTQSLIERCFPSLLCKIRLFTNNDKRKNKKYFSKKDPINEIFKFDLDQYTLEQSYLKIHVLGHHKNDKRVELGHTVFVLNQYDNLMIRAGHHHDGGLAASEQHTKSIPINEDRIDMITQQQISSENEARALISLVYENDRCLLHIGVIKIIGIQCLLKQPIGHSHHRDLIQIKICTIVDGKITTKRKSKAIIIEKNLFTFSTSFHFEYLSLHKTSVRITICYRKTLMTSQNKPISLIEFGSTQLKNQQVFQHWTDTLSEPNRPHVQWHALQSIDTINQK
ncbi:unnamed protein product [Rotaria sp. Silwood2]|nr:unnamed protein product [Rotaria sp. Silwood2]CAF3115181.1 unnamed protein product [Rotaria sp. Silwood2]CAF4282950.1 unnamed protein product [Rotaria sp. Silwood2]CAF4417311.1 unnamed protein product [Rotaria sp. Silwood2]